jgi:glutamine amidotransferase-like uncharacterized protein
MESPSMSKGKGKQALLFSILVGISLQILSCASYKTETQSIEAHEEVLLFYPQKYKGVPVGCYADIISYRKIAEELGYPHNTVDHQFINTRESFFNNNGKRKFRVLLFPGGEPNRWFEQAVGEGINCQGVKNILDFIESGGSAIAICICAPSLFSTWMEFLNPTLKQAQRGEWDKTWRSPGWFKRFCGVYAFKGVLRGPQESNRPYPKAVFLPIKMNPDNEIVREANLPPVIHQIVVGGGSILPDDGQPLDVVGWFPNGTAAIGIVPYGQGRIILSNPHPNITGQLGEKWRRGVMSTHARRWGWTEEMIREGQKLIQETPDPDGPEPDWALAKAMLSYAYTKAPQ